MSQRVSSPYQTRLKWRSDVFAYQYWLDRRKRFVELVLGGGCHSQPGPFGEKGDFLVQFMPDGEGHSHEGPLDMRSPELSCMVQVKTSLDSSPSSDIKLWNWRPWFVLFVFLDEARSRRVHG